MRVITNNDVIEVTCSRCGSELAAEIHDIQHTDIGHGRAEMQWVNCCVCGREVCVPLKQIPVHWRSYIFADDD